MKNIRLVLFASLLLIAPSLFAGATITIINLDGANEGFNDPTPAAPVGGNNGTTVGQQRLIAFQHAASIWGALLDSSVEIRIQAAFNPLSCNATSAVLGSAGAITVSRDFAGAEWAGTWYSAALANKRSGIDRVPAQNDLNAQFNSSLGGLNPNGTPCFTGGGWYYGLDGNRGTKTDLVIVLLHEFAHGLGFQTFANTQAGTLFSGLPDTYNRHLADNTLGGALWPSLTNAQRAASALNQYNVVWTGAEVTAQAPSFLRNAPVLRVDSPASLGTKVGQDATFGPALTTAGTSGVVVEAIDALEPVAGATTKDGCSPITSNVSGKIAVMDRGVCTFNVKVKNAQDAGAIGAIIVNNTATGLPGMGGIDATVTIPSIGITLADGNQIRANLGGGVSGTILIDTTRRQGSGPGNQVFVNTPPVFAPGSSVSHFDPVASPNLLMEPNISGDLTHNVDLTLPQMRDIGWYPDGDLDFVDDRVDNCPTVANTDQANNDGDAQGDACDTDDDNDGVADTADNCPFTANGDQANHDGDGQGDACDADDDNDGFADANDSCPLSNLSPTIVIAGCDTGVINTLTNTGCTYSDQIADLAAAANNHGDFVSAVSAWSNNLKKAGIISGAEHAAIVSCAAKSN